MALEVLLQPDAGWSGLQLRPPRPNPPFASQMQNVLSPTRLPHPTEFCFTEDYSLCTHCSSQAPVVTLSHNHPASPWPKTRERQLLNHTLPAAFRSLLPSNTNPWPLNQLFGHLHLPLSHSQRVPQSLLLTDLWKTGLPGP